MGARLVRAGITGVERLASDRRTQHSGRVKGTFDIDDDLYRAVKVEAARSDRNVGEVVEEALEQWLERVEQAEHRASAAALDEYQPDGGIAAEELFARNAADSMEIDGPSGLE